MIAHPLDHRKLTDNERCHLANHLYNKLRLNAWKEIPHKVGKDINISVYGAGKLKKRVPSRIPTSRFLSTLVMPDEQLQTPCYSLLLDWEHYQEFFAEETTELWYRWEALLSTRRIRNLWLREKGTEDYYFRRNPEVSYEVAVAGLHLVKFVTIMLVSEQEYQRYLRGGYARV